MRYAELLEYAFPKIHTIDVKSDKHPGRATGRDKDTEYVGGGSFADTFANPKRTPHDVRKLSNMPRSRELDGFFYYIKALENHNDNTNPYFPRFRGIKIYIERDDFTGWASGEADPRRDEITYSAQMERLEDMRKLSDEEVQSIMQRLFGENTDAVNEVLGRMDHPYGQKLLTVIKQAVKHAESRAGLNGMFVDEEFVRATAFVGKIAEKYSIGLDLHDENIMVRRGPTGVHLVITDPLSNVHGDDVSHATDITAD